MPKPKKKPRGKPFAGVDDPRMAHNRKVEEPAEADAPGVSVYEHMDHCYRNPPAMDRTHGQRVCRRWMRKNEPLFMAKYLDIQRERAGGQVAWDGVGPCPTCNRPPEGVDRGTRLAESVCRDVLARIRAEAGLPPEGNR